jgi:hypothetical protein
MRGIASTTILVRPARNADATALGTYPSRSAAPSTRARVVGEIRWCSTPLST